MAKENLSSAGEPDFDSLQIEQGDTYSLSSVNFFMGRILSKISPRRLYQKWRLLDALT